MRRTTLAIIATLALLIAACEEDTDSNGVPPTATPEPTPTQVLSPEDEAIEHYAFMMSSLASEIGGYFILIVELAEDVGRMGEPDWVEEMTELADWVIDGVREMRDLEAPDTMSEAHELVSLAADAYIDAMTLLKAGIDPLNDEVIDQAAAKMAEASGYLSDATALVQEVAD